MLSRIIELIQNYWPMYLEGTINTLTISIIGTFFGMILGFMFTMVRSIEIPKKQNSLKIILTKMVQKFITIYIDVVRGTPMMIQAIIIFNLFAYYLDFRNLLIIGSLIVILNTAAYSAEIIKAGINGIDKGQLESARSIGMTHKQAMIKIVLPQAFKNSIPAIGNELIVNIKDTSVLSVIGVMDLMNMQKSVASINYYILESAIVAALIYLVLTTTCTKILYYLDKRFNSPYNAKRNYTIPSSQTAPEVLS